MQKVYQIPTFPDRMNFEPKILNVDRIDEYDFWVDNYRYPRYCATWMVFGTKQEAMTRHKDNLIQQISKFAREKALAEKNIEILTRSLNELEKNT